MRFDCQESAWFLEKHDPNVEVPFFDHGTHHHPNRQPCWKGTLRQLKALKGRESNPFCQVPEVLRCVLCQQSFMIFSRKISFPGRDLLTYLPFMCSDRLEPRWEVLDWSVYGQQNHCLRGGLKQSGWLKQGWPRTPPNLTHFFGMSQNERTPHYILWWNFCVFFLQ